MTNDKLFKQNNPEIKALLFIEISPTPNFLPSMTDVSTIFFRLDNYFSINITNEETFAALRFDIQPKR